MRSQPFALPTPLGSAEPGFLPWPIEASTMGHEPPLSHRSELPELPELPALPALHGGAGLESEFDGSLDSDSPPLDFPEVAPPRHARSGDSLAAALASLRGPCRRARADACRMLERLGNDGDGMAAFELGRLLKCGLGDIRPRPHIALDWLQHALVGGVLDAAPLIVELAIELGRGDLANLAAALERAVAPEGAPLRRRVQRHARAPPEPAQSPHTAEAATQTKARHTPQTVPERVLAHFRRQAEREANARWWHRTPPGSPDPDPFWGPNR